MAERNHTFSGIRDFTSPSYALTVPLEGAVENDNKKNSVNFKNSNDMNGDVLDNDVEDPDYTIYETSDSRAPSDASSSRLQAAVENGNNIEPVLSVLP